VAGQANPNAAPSGSRVLLLDNYDSFTWNLAQYLEELGAQVDVRLNDSVDLPWIEQQGFDAIVISPGPGRPEAAGISLALVRAVAGRTPLLGVCLGHQAIGLAYGASIGRAPTIMHGKTSWIDHDGEGLFHGLPQPFVATRYHSLVIDPDSIDGALKVTARSPDGAIMAVQHRDHPLFGVQFHPESVLTVDGKQLLGNFLALARREAPLARSSVWW
jgi:anthranilate synthase/aminodeoxychorismate synthase-like glutamine amidotransferase